MAVYDPGTVVKKIGDDIYGKIVDGSGEHSLLNSLVNSALKMLGQKPDKVAQPDGTITVMFMEGIRGMRSNNKCANYTSSQLAESFVIVDDYGTEISRIERELASVEDNGAESAIRARRLQHAKQYLEEICRREKPTIPQGSSLATN